MYRVHEVRKNCLCAVGNQIEGRQREISHMDFHASLGKHMSTFANPSQ